MGRHYFQLGHRRNTHIRDLTKLKKWADHKLKKDAKNDRTGH